MSALNPFETEDLRAWGYAPGSYVFKCQDCPADLDIYDKMGKLGDKRSWRCEEHARAARDATPALSPQTLPAPGEVEEPTQPATLQEGEVLPREPMAYLGKRYTIEGVLAEMLAVGAAEHESDLADDWPLDCRVDVDRWQAVLSASVAAGPREGEAINGLQPAPGHADGCGAHDDYACDCATTPTPPTLSAQDLQTAWDRVDSLPPIEFKQDEADEILAALARAQVKAS